MGGEGLGVGFLGGSTLKVLCLYPSETRNPKPETRNPKPETLTLRDEASFEMKPQASSLEAPRESLQPQVYRPTVRRQTLRAKPLRV